MSLKNWKYNPKTRGYYKKTYTMDGPNRIGTVHRLDDEGELISTEAPAEEEKKPVSLKNYKYKDPSAGVSTLKELSGAVTPSDIIATRMAGSIAMNANKAPEQGISNSRGDTQILTGEPYNLTREGQWAAKHPIAGTLMYGAANLVGGAEGFINTGEAALRALATGEKMNPHDIHAAPIAQAFRTGAAEGFRREAEESHPRISSALGIDSDDGRYTFGEKATDFLTGVGADAVSSGISMAAGGPLSTLLMGGSAANQSLYETSNDPNTTARQAAELALANGAAEAFFEHFSVERLLNFQNPTSTAQAVRAALAQAGVEASEEMFTEIANTLSDIAIRKDYSERGREYQDYIKQGMDPNAAATNTMRSAVTQIFLAGLGGALSGGLHTGAAMYGNTIANGMDLRRDLQSGMTLEDIAESIDTSTAEGQRVQDIANDIAQREASGTRASDTDLGYLSNAIANAAEVAERNEAVEGAAAPVEGAVEGTQDVVSETTERENTARQAATQAMNDVASETAKDTGEAFRNANYYNSQRMTAGERIFNAEMAEDMASTFGEEGQKAFSALPADEGVKAYREWAAHYNNMRFGMPIREGMSTTLSPEQISAAMRAGALDANRAYPQDTMKAVNRAVNKIRVNGVNAGNTDLSGIDYKSLTPQQRLRVDYTSTFVTKGLGMDVRYVKSEAVDGKYKGMNGSFQVINGRPTITLDVNAGMNRESDWTGDITDIKSMLPVISHETTHFLEQYNPKLYKELSNTVLTALQNNGTYSKGMTINSIIEAERQRLNDTIKDENGKPVQHTQDDAIHELVARACEDMLSGDKKALDAFNSLDAQTKQTLWDHVKQVFDNIREFFAQMLSSYKSDSAEAKAIRQNMEEFEKIRDMWQEALNSESIVHASEVSSSNDTSTGEFSIRQFAQALDFDVRINSEGQAFEIIDPYTGKAIKKVTEEMMEQTPMGFMVRAAQNAGTIDQQTADKQIKMFKDLMNLTLRYDQGTTPMVWEVAGSFLFSSVKTNADKQYSTTVDYGTICSKTQALIDVLSKTMVEKGRGLTRDEVLKAYNETAKTGLSVPCPPCYVFSRWMGVPSLLETMRKCQERFGNVSEQEVQNYINSMLDQYGDAKGVNSEKTKVQKRLETLERKLQEANANKDLAAQADIQKEVRSLEKKISDLESFNWVTQVRCVKSKNGKYTLDRKYRPVPNEVLLDLRRSGDFAQKYPKSWKYRTTRGAGMGKAIMPYSGATIGDFIKGTKDRWTDAKNPFYSKNDKASRTAIVGAQTRAKAQNLIGGQRFQSTSDFRAEWGIDYLMTFLECQLANSQVQLYTKVIEAVDMFASAGAEVNLSIMPMGDGHKNGKLVFSDVTGINFNDALKKTRKYDNVQMILVGINDDHIRLAMADDRISFIIPWHSSGNSKDTLASLMQSVGEKLNNASDYSKTQNDKVIDNSEGMKAIRKFRKDIIQGKLWENYKNKTVKSLTAEQKSMLDGNKYLSDLYRRFYQDSSAKEYGVRLNGNQSSSIFPYEYWDTSLTVKDADQNGRRFQEYCASLGIQPRFSQFANDTGYWKLLIDRRMYNRDGTYHDPKAIDVTNVKVSQVPQAVNSNNYKDMSKINQATLDTIRAIDEKQNDLTVTEDVTPTISDGSGPQYSTRDSQGKELTESQAEYFKDSKVRDAEGNLKVMYHGTERGGFTVFDPAESEDGISLFFTDYSENAREYSGSYGEITPDRRMSESELFYMIENITEGDFQLSRTADGYAIEEYTLDDEGNFTYKPKKSFKTLKEAQAYAYEEFVKEGRNGGYGTIPGNYAVYLNLQNPLVVDAQDSSWSEIPYLENDDGELEPATTREIAEDAKEQGYDGVIINNVFDNGQYAERQGVEANIAIAFSSNQVKSVYNENPTENNDIRYSSRMQELDAEYQEALDARNEDWQLMLVDQAAYEAGYTTTAYHGSPFTDINVFNTRSQVTKKTPMQLLFGTHFTQSLDYAKLYAQKAKNSKGTSRMTTKTGRVYKTYLDLGKSLDLRTPANITPGTDEYKLYEDAPAKYKKKYPPYTFSKYDTEQGLGSGQYITKATIENVLQAMSPKDATDFLIDHGYNSVLYDANYATPTTGNNRFTRDPSIIMLDPERIKSGDPVTYDDNGNVIPLSERFNSENEDIRYSQRDVDMSGTLDEFMERMDNRFLDRLADLDGEENAQLRQDLEDAYRANLEWTISEMQRRMDSAVGAEKKKAKKRLDALRARKNQRIDEVIADFREKRFRERVKRSERKAQQELLRRARRLAKKKGDPNFRAQVDALIGDLDLVAAGIRSDTRSKLEEIKKQVEAQSELDPDYAKYEAPKYADLIGRLGKKHISQMKIEDIVQLTESIVALEHSKRTADREIKEGVGRTFGHYGKVAVEQQSRIKGINYKNEIGAQLGKYKLNMLNPVRAFSLIDGYQRDGVFTYFGKQLNDGQTKAAQFRMDVEKMFQDIDNNPKLVNDFAKQNIEIDTLEGKKKISKGMRIALYLHLQNAENVKHIAFGGITIPNERLYSRGKYAEAYAAGETVHLSEWIPGAKGESVFSEINRKNDAAAAAAIRKITDQMTPEELEYAKIAEKFFNETTKNAINEVSLELNGYEKATVEHYFPISTNKNFLQSSYDGLVKDGTLEGMGMLKERSGSRLPIYLEDASQVVLRQKNNTALYYGLAVPIRNFTRFYNYTGGERLERSVKASVGKAWNKPGLNYIDNVLNDLQFGRQTQRSVTDVMKSVYAGTTLNLNLGVAIKQSASYPFAASVIGWGPLAKAARHVVSKADREYMDSITPWGYMRRTGFSGTEMGEVAKQRTGIDNNRLVQRTKTALDLIRRVDVKTTEVLFFACEEYVKEKYPDLKVRGEEYNRKLAEVYNETLQRTQPSYDVMQRNEFLRSQNDLAKIFGAFKTQTFNMGGEVIDAWSRWRAYSEYAKTDSSYKEAKREAAKAFGNTIAATIVAQGMLVVLSAAANAVLHKMRDYRDERGEITAESLAKKILKDFGTSFAGLTMGGSEARDFALALLGDGKWYDIDYPGLTLVNDFASATVDFRKAASKAVETGNEEDMQKASAKMAKLIMQMFKLKGVPSQNLYNIVNAIYLWSTDYKNGQLGSFEAGQGLFGLQDTSPSKDQYAKQALDAYKNGDTKKGDRALEKAGESAIKKEIGGRQEEAAQFLKGSGFGDTVNRKLWEGAGWKLKNYDKNMK